MRRYLVTTKQHPPFLTDDFDADNHFIINIGMIVYDLVLDRFTTDGQIWNPIQINRL